MRTCAFRVYIASVSFVWEVLGDGTFLRHGHTVVLHLLDARAAVSIPEPVLGAVQEAGRLALL